MAIKRYKRSVNKKPGDHQRVHYSEKQRAQAVSTYLVTGNAELTAVATKIDISTIRRWKREDWWKQAENDLRQSENIRTTNKLQKLKDKAVEVVMDRLEHGEWQYNPKTGQVQRVPMRAKVAVDVMKSSIDKELVLQRLEQKEVIKEEAILDRLKTIQDSLLVAASKPKNVIDLVPVKEDSSNVDSQ